MTGPNWDEYYESAINDNVIHLDPETRLAVSAQPPDVAGFWARELGDLCEAPPPRSWFLTDNRTNQGMLLASKVFLLAADGGVGKGFFLMQTAVCTTLGIDLFDTFRPMQGHVALFVAEDDAEECRNRLWRISNAMHLGREERRQVGSRLKFFPLTGSEVSLFDLDRQGNARRTVMFDSIIARLTKDAAEGDFEWRFVAFDPLARFAGGNAEADNEIATKFMGALEAIANAVPGKPAIACAHHESKTGRGSNRVDVRGVTGLRNGVRAVLGLKPFDADDGGRGVRLENDKNNCAVHAADVWLVRMGNEQMHDGRWLETAGALRLATDGEREALEAVAGVKAGDPEAKRKERDVARETAKISKAQERRAGILQCLPLTPNHLTTAEVEAAMERVGLARHEDGTSPELRALVDLNLVQDLSGGGRGKARMWCRLQ